MVASMSFNPSFVSILLCSMLDPDGHPAYSTPKLFLLVHNSHIEKSETSWSYAVEMCGLVMWRKCSKLLVHVWALHFMHFFISDIFGFNGTSYQSPFRQVLSLSSCLGNTPKAIILEPSRPADNLNDWAESHNFPLIGHKNCMYRVISESLYKKKTLEKHKKLGDFAAQ